MTQKCSDIASSTNQLKTLALLLGLEKPLSIYRIQPAWFCQYKVNQYVLKTY